MKIFCGVGLKELCARTAMNYAVDVFVLLFLVAFVFICAKRGFIECFFSLVSTMIALFIAVTFAKLMLLDQVGLLPRKIIDLSPFVDPVTGQKYVYFCHDLGKTFGYTKSSNYVMKLNDDYTPDYTSVKHLTTAESTLKEGSVNEAPFVLYKSGKYYLLYSVNNYKNVGYSVRVAVSDSPDGTFTKLTDAQGGYLLYGTDKGTGHCSVVSRDGQTEFTFTLPMVN